MQKKGNRPTSVRLSDEETQILEYLQKEMSKNLAGAPASESDTIRWSLRLAAIYRHRLEHHDPEPKCKTCKLLQLT